MSWVSRWYNTPAGGGDVTIIVGNAGAVDLAADAFEIGMGNAISASLEIRVLEATFDGQRTSELASQNLEVQR